jgi:hypothetical protein
MLQKLLLASKVFYKKKSSTLEPLTIEDHFLNLKS